MKRERGERLSKNEGKWRKTNHRRRRGDDKSEKLQSRTNEKIKQVNEKKKNCNESEQSSQKKNNKVRPNKKRNGKWNEIK